MSAIVLSGGKILFSGGGAFQINPPSPNPSLFKHTPGVYPVSINSQTSGVTQGQITSDLAALNSKPYGAGYTIGIRWDATDANSTPPSNPSVSQATINSQFPQFVSIIQFAGNALWAQTPSAKLCIYITGAFYGNANSFQQANIPSQNFSGVTVPPYLSNCGGTLNIPNSYTCSSTTADHHLRAMVRLKLLRHILR